jgi:hypothetical protein
MSWNYRVIHMTQETLNGEEEDVYQIVEMFYEDNNVDKPNGWGDASPQGESLADLDDVLTRMRTAFLKPVIDVCGECHNIAPNHKPDWRHRASVKIMTDEMSDDALRVPYAGLVKWIATAQER